MIHDLNKKLVHTLSTVSGLERVLEILRQIDAQGALRFEALTGQITALHSQLAAAHNQIAAMANEVNATVNKVIETSDRLARIETQFGGETFEAMSRSTALLAAGQVARYTANDHERDLVQSRYQPATIVPIQSSLERLRNLTPEIYPFWQQLFQNDTISYEQDIEASASIWGHKYAQLFGAYLALFGRGRTLDIGCGINGKPSYLSAIPNEQISGLEPRSQRADPGFECVQGFNEFLPWPDGAFNTVVSGTSLDHVLSLEKSLSEVARVLAPGGRYLVWLASIAGSPPYEPDAPEFKPRDAFHLFHFDRVWIEPLFAKFFDFQDVTIIPQPGFDHVFYCLTSKRP